MLRRHTHPPLLLLTAVVAACGTSTGVEDVATALTLSDDEVALAELGSTAQVTATVLDQSGGTLNGATVSWSSSNTRVARVVDGLITAEGTGAATITAAAGGPMASLIVTVQPPGAGATGPSFSTVVHEVLERRGCTAGVCHGGGAGGLALTFSVPGNYQNLVNVPSNGEPATLLVAPGDAANSYLVMKLAGTASVGARMPLNLPPLSAADMDNITDWIDGGAASN